MKDTNLDYCIFCNQMTNHDGDKCLKHNEIESEEGEQIPSVDEAVTYIDERWVTLSNMTVGARRAVLRELLTTRDAYWEKRPTIDPIRVGMLRQYINEKEAGRLMSNGDIMFWLTGDEEYLKEKVTIV